MLKPRRPLMPREVVSFSESVMLVMLFMFLVPSVVGLAQWRVLCIVGSSGDVCWSSSVAVVSLSMFTRYGDSVVSLVIYVRACL